ncbi:MAG TPA: DUF2950 domain-containing protein [Steroidobacteraceae bacterium]|nr:DUF2950 domain-containing protein [Steroidobacteraceae bacterium]
MAVSFAASSSYAQTTAPANSQAAKPTSSKAAKQTSFATPEDAANALIEATAKYDVPALLGIFGPAGEDFISSADPVEDKNNAQNFANAAKKSHDILINSKNPNRATLVVGEGQWPLPVPIVKTAGRWTFSTREGHTEILIRRIGANELNAIQVCRGFVEAQHDYASEIHDDSGIRQYAQRIISTPGKHDGLYWQNPDGSPGGSVSVAAGRAIEEGYTLDRKSAYHGYYFKVLKGQGAAAPLGRLDYVIGGVMIGGFALLATPAEYRVTGVKTFMVDYNGIVFQKDLGPDSLNIAKRIVLYNPDKTWERTDDQWPPDTADAAAGP